MQPYKLLACLVTLQLMCGLTLSAADPQDYRSWTDTKGRTMNARLLDAHGADRIKIERHDGQIFTVALTLFSAADQAYVKAWHAEQGGKSAAETDDSSKENGGLKAVDDTTWSLLNSATQPESTYSQTRLDHILEGVNQRFAIREVKTPGGAPIQVLTEPSDLASRIKISGDMPRMTVGTLVKELARANNLVVKTDASGMVVLVEKSPSTTSAPPIQFLGATAK